jgi:NADPH-dependent 2,4-dienoyl-CoA reductase/sulfur reductase-like enzyme
MANQLGDLAAGLLAQVHTENGVRLRRETSVSSFTEYLGTLAGVTLDTGDTLVADLVVLAIGAEPATGWLASSGLRLCDGIICDATCIAAEGIYAVGDVARFHHESFGHSMRLENRTNATEQAIVVADNIMGDARQYVPIPYFWTDQYDARIQVHGTAAPGADFVIVDGDVASRRFVGEWHVEGQTTGILGWNMPKQTRIRRQRMTADAPIVK